MHLSRFVFATSFITKIAKLGVGNGMLARRGVEMIVPFSGVRSNHRQLRIESSTVPLFGRIGGVASILRHRLIQYNNTALITRRKKKRSHSPRSQQHQGADPRRSLHKSTPSDHTALLLSPSELSSLPPPPVPLLLSSSFLLLLLPRFAEALRVFRSGVRPTY